MREIVLFNLDIALEYQLEDKKWKENANCSEADPEIFMPVDGPPREAEAKAICGQCEVAADCLEYALRHGEKFGIWGGKTEEERRQMKLSRVAAKRAVDNVFGPEDKQDDLR